MPALCKSVVSLCQPQLRRQASKRRSIFSHSCRAVNTSIYATTYAHINMYMYKCMCIPIHTHERGNMWHLVWQLWAFMAINNFCQRLRVFSATRIAKFKGGFGLLNFFPFFAAKNSNFIACFLFPHSRFVGLSFTFIALQ